MAKGRKRKLAAIGTIAAVIGRAGGFVARAAIDLVPQYDTLLERARAVFRPGRPHEYHRRHTERYCYVTCAGIGRDKHINPFDNAFEQA